MVKGLLPTGRVFVSFRYTMGKTHELFVGTIILRYPNLSRWNERQRWMGSSDDTKNQDPLFRLARFEDKDFKVLKAMMEGGSMEETGGRQLSIFNQVRMADHSLEPVETKV